jgi:hypothetical protein
MALTWTCTWLSLGLARGSHLNSHVALTRNRTWLSLGLARGSHLNSHVALTWTRTWLSLGFAHGLLRLAHGSHFDLATWLKLGLAQCTWLIFGFARGSHIDGSYLDSHVALTWTCTWLILGLTRGSHMDSHVAQTFTYVLAGCSHLYSNMALILTPEITQSSGGLIFKPRVTASQSSRSKLRTSMLRQLLR